MKKTLKTLLASALLIGSVAFALVEGIVGAYLALWLDAPPGPAVAVLGGVIFTAVALATSPWRVTA